MLDITVYNSIVDFHYKKCTIYFVEYSGTYLLAYS